MVFTKNSMLVKTWVSLVLAGAYTKDQVPRLFNLKTVVGEIVDGLIGEQERQMLEFIVKYWLEFFFSGVLALLGAGYRKLNLKLKEQGKMNKLLQQLSAAFGP